MMMGMNDKFHPKSLSQNIDSSTHMDEQRSKTYRSTYNERQTLFLATASYLLQECLNFIMVERVELDKRSYKLIS
jgi:hypothetical protein